MFNDILKDEKLKSFFSKWDKNAEFLLGFSGGVDSTFLFFLLKEFGIHFTAVYIDHGWRSESVQESVYLRELCRRENINFKTTVIPYNVYNRGNMENIARDFRLNFFKELCDQEGFIGVFLAHHADDQSETLIKRIFEGSSLWNLRGLSEITDINGLLVLRPLLHLRKSFFIDYLCAYNISYLVDSSNKDEKFLRARMRRRIIPFLENNFGKNLNSSLNRISESSKELLDFLKQESQKYLSRIIREDNFILLDMSFEVPSAAFLWKFVLKEFFAEIQISTSAINLDNIMLHLQKKNKNKTLRLGNKIILMDEGVLKINF